MFEIFESLNWSRGLNLYYIKINSVLLFFDIKKFQPKFILRYITLTKLSVTWVFKALHLVRSTSLQSLFVYTFNLFLDWSYLSSFKYNHLLCYTTLVICHQNNLIFLDISKITFCYFYSQLNCNISLKGLTILVISWPMVKMS